MENPYPENTLPTDGYKPDAAGTGLFSLSGPQSLPGIRVIINLNSPSPCGTYNGDCPFMKKEDLNHAPAEVAQRGVSDAVWKQWMKRFEEEVTESTMSCCFGGLCWLSVVGIPYICYMQNKLQKKVLRFQQDFNQQVLEPLGMYCKTQMSCLSQSPPEADEERINNDAARWISIALTKAEVERLKAEEHCFLHSAVSESGVHRASPERNACLQAWSCGIKQVI